MENTNDSRIARAGGKAGRLTGALHRAQCHDLRKRHVGSRYHIWFDAVLRAEDDPIVIGDETNVQDHVMVHIDFGHPVHIGSRVTIGHNAVVHGCTVEDDVLIGMNATILNDAHVGKGSLVAAGALVLEGQVIPPNSLVAGVPAKVKKVFTAQEVEDRQNYYIPLYLKEGADYAATMGSGVPKE